MQRTPGRGSASTARGFDLTNEKAQRAAQGVAGLANAAYALDAKGSARVLAFGNAIAALAATVGGPLVAGIAIAVSAITALFLQAEEKSEQARKAIIDDIIAIGNAGDLAATFAEQAAYECAARRRRDDEPVSALHYFVDPIIEQWQFAEARRLVDEGPRVEPLPSQRAPNDAAADTALARVAPAHQQREPAGAGAQEGSG